MLCVRPEISESLLEELHEEIRRSHIGEDPYLIRPLLRDTGGQACKKRRKNMLENVINVKDSLQTFTSLEEFLILFLALGLLLNRAWTL